MVKILFVRLTDDALFALNRLKKQTGLNESQLVHRWLLDESYNLDESIARILQVQDKIYKLINPEDKVNEKIKSESKRLGHQS